MICLRCEVRTRKREQGASWESELARHRINTICLGSKRIEQNSSLHIAHYPISIIKTKELLRRLEYRSVELEYGLMIMGRRVLAFRDNDPGLEIGMQAGLRRDR